MRDKLNTRLLYTLWPIFALPRLPDLQTQMIWMLRMLWPRLQSRDRWNNHGCGWCWCWGRCGCGGNCGCKRCCSRGRNNIHEMMNEHLHSSANHQYHYPKKHTSLFVLSYLLSCNQPTLLVPSFCLFCHAFHIPKSHYFNIIYDINIIISTPGSDHHQSTLIDPGLVTRLNPKQLTSKTLIFKYEHIIKSVENKQ